MLQGSPEDAPLTPQDNWPSPGVACVQLPSRAYAQDAAFTPIPLTRRKHGDRHGMGTNSPVPIPQLGQNPIRNILPRITSMDWRMYALGTKGRPHLSDRKTLRPSYTFCGRVSNGISG